MKVHRFNEIPEGFARETRFNRLNTRREQVFVSVGELITGGEFDTQFRERQTLGTGLPGTQHEVPFNRLGQFDPLLVRFHFIAIGRLQELDATM